MEKEDDDGKRKRRQRREESEFESREAKKRMDSVMGNAMCEQGGN